MNQRGFTLPELIVALVLFVALLIGATFLLRTNDYTVRLQNAERRLEVASIAQAILRYRSETGEWPAGIPEEATAIGSPEDHYDLCTVLVPKYLKDIPLDPVLGTKLKSQKFQTNAPCNAEGIDYGSAYAVALKDNTLVVSAPIAEDTDILVSVAER